MYAFRIVCVLAATCLLTACGPEPGPTVSLNGVTIDVIVADDAEELSRGLQGYDPLDEGEGMLFVFDDVAPRTFAMKEVSFPIDVLFVAEDGTVSAIEPLDPGDMRLVTSPSPSPYAVELPQGWAAENGIVIGDRFDYRP